MRPSSKACVIAVPGRVGMKECSLFFLIMDIGLPFFFLVGGGAGFSPQLKLESFFNKVKAFIFCNPKVFLQLLSTLYACLNFLLNKVLIKKNQLVN